MLTAIIGLISSALLYLGVVYAFVWTGERRMRWGERHGFLLTPEPKIPTAAEIVKRRSTEMIVIYSGVFVLLGLMDFTIWARLGFAAIGAVVFGSASFANTPHDLALPGTSLVARVNSRVGYWCLAVLDWFGFFGVLCFGTALLIEAF
jgi:hypothetical protein